MTATNEHPMKIIARMSHSPKLAARQSDGLVTIAQVRAIRDLQYERADRRRWTDPLIWARNSRSYRTRSAVALREARQTERRADDEAQARREREERLREEATRKSLLAAARVARSLGFAVRSSKDRSGRVSSYYIGRPGQPDRIRISDHDLPWSPRRDFMAREHGNIGFDGFHGGELIINQPRRAEWLRRAIILTAAGRPL